MPKVSHFSRISHLGGNSASELKAWCAAIQPLTLTKSTVQLGYSHINNIHTFELSVVEAEYTANAEIDLFLLSSRSFIFKLQQIFYYW